MSSIHKPPAARLTSQNERRTVGDTGSVHGYASLRTGQARSGLYLAALDQANKLSWPIRVTIPIARGGSIDPPRSGPLAARRELCSPRATARDPPPLVGRSPPPQTPQALPDRGKQEKGRKKKRADTARLITPPVPNPRSGARILNLRKHPTDGITGGKERTGPQHAPKTEHLPQNGEQPRNRLRASKNPCTTGATTQP
jgi:hypothetical protein